MSQSQLHLNLEHSAAEATTSCDVTTLFHCLVVSTHRDRRQMLRNAAREGGWHTYLAEDAAAAARRATLTTVQLAIVDLDRTAPLDQKELLELLPHLAQTGGLLLMVCGNAADVQEELAARRQGVWMYLPGVVDGAGVQSLCIEAREIAERIHVPVAMPRRRASESKRETL